MNSHPPTCRPQTHSAWAQNRPCPFSDLASDSALRAAWDFSTRRWQSLQQALSVIPDEVACVAVSGSLSRMEAHENSDLDLLVIVDDRHKQRPHRDTSETYQRIWEQLRIHPDLNTLTMPKPGGVFSECVSWNKLTDVRMRGIVAEDMTVYGQRMQLLLDAQPIGPADVFVNLQTDLLTWYTETQVSKQFDEAGPFHWLWQDVQRYWRSIRARANWLHHDQPAQSREVNLKLRSSRLTLIAAFLHSIAHAHGKAGSLSDAINCLCQQLTRTPLERLMAALPEKPQTLLTAYETIWSEIRRRPPSANDIPQPVLTAVKQLRNSLGPLTQLDEPDWWL